MFGPKLLATYQSRYSGEIRVMQPAFSQSLYVATGSLTQTGGVIKDLWTPVIKKLLADGSKPQNVLILGLAGGTLAALLSQSFAGIKIVGVEIDPVMIEIGKKYLDMDRIGNLEIILSDANLYVSQTPHLHFDLVFVDLYVADKLPKFAYTDKFVSRLPQIAPKSFINHLYFDDDKKNHAQQLVNTCSRYFPRLELIRSLSNLIIIAG